MIKLFFFSSFIKTKNVPPSIPPQKSGTHRVLNSERLIGLVGGDGDLEGDRPFFDRRAYHLAENNNSTFQPRRSEAKTKQVNKIQFNSMQLNSPRDEGVLWYE